jgi:hypothetical protein
MDRTPAMAGSLMAESASTSQTSPAQPLCALDVCQPVVYVSDFAPRWDTRGRRTEVLLALLDRMDLGALSSAARWIVATGIPERAQAVQVNVTMRWRIGAFGAPLGRTE